MDARKAAHLAWIIGLNTPFDLATRPDSANADGTVSLTLDEYGECFVGVLEEIEAGASPVLKGNPDRDELQEAARLILEELRQHQ